MNNDNHKIFSEHPNLTEEEIKNYLSGTLPKTERRKIELKMAANDFDSEAMEGFEADPAAVEHLDKLQEKIKKDYHSPSFNSWKIISIMGLFSGTLAIIFFLYTNQKNYNDPEKFTSENLKKELLPKHLSTDSANYALIKEIETATPIAKSKQVTSADIIHQQKEIQEVVPRDEVEIPNPISPKEANKVKTDVKRSLAVKTAQNIVYYSDLKIYDYSKVYTSTIPVKNIQLTGLGANKADESQEDHDPAYEYTYISYSEFMQQVMEKFSKDQYKEALKDFHTILKHFPDDVNAHFYGGLSYYNLNMIKKAIHHFHAVERNVVFTFNEEAEWFKALSYLQKGETNTGKKLLKEIIEKEGYYTEKAKEKLTSIH